MPIPELHTAGALSRLVRHFFGSFPGGEIKLKSDISKLKDENKSRKRKAHRNLMIDCGGGGKEGNIPPAEYVPEVFSSEKMCTFCKLDFITNEKLREHVRMVHDDQVRKGWLNDAMANISYYQEYRAWLQSPYCIENKKTMMLPLREKNLNIAQSQEAYVKVSQKGSIMETRRETITQNKDGTIKRSILTEQFANVTIRNHEDIENDNPNHPKKRKRHQIQGFNDILEHMSGGNVEMKTNILSRVIDTQGTNVAAGVVKNSKEIQMSNKLSKEQTAALISGSNMSDYQVKQLRTACNKELGQNPFASANKVTQARTEQLSISKDDFEATYQDLYSNKMGKNADKG